MVVAKRFDLHSDTTSVFKATGLKKDKLLSFDDNNTLTIKNPDIRMACKEAPGGKYNLSVTVKNKLIFTKNGIKGITKVLCQDGYLMFSLFTYSDEDGNNEGYGYVINTNNGSVKTFSQKLKNTCNPVVFNNGIYFVNNLTLLKTDMNMKLNSMIVISYKSNNKRFTDTYAISGITSISNSLVIDFTSDRFKVKSKLYSGEVGSFTKFITLSQ